MYDYKIIQLVRDTKYSDFAREQLKMFGYSEEDINELIEKYDTEGLEVNEC
nr:MAG TPA: neurotoxin [Caudoviricetes sp.]